MANAAFDEFLKTISDDNKQSAVAMHELLLQNGCTCDVKPAKSGFLVSYLAGKPARTVASFICRKTGVKLRVYPKSLGQYEPFLDTLPPALKKEIKKASACKRLLDPSACNPKCGMGYDFCLDGERQQKCRYMAFQLTLSPKTSPFIQQFLAQELACQSP